MPRAANMAAYVPAVFGYPFVGPVAQAKADMACASKSCPGLSRYGPSCRILNKNSR
jgi:hypothetical protein